MSCRVYIFLLLKIKWTTSAKGVCNARIYFMVYFSLRVLQTWQSATVLQLWARETQSLMQTFHSASLLLSLCVALKFKGSLHSLQLGQISSTLSPSFSYTFLKADLMSLFMDLHIILPSGWGGSTSPSASCCLQSIICLTRCSSSPAQ